MASLYFFGGLLKAFCRVAMVEPPVSYSYLESTVPAAACEVAISVRSAGRACSYDVSIFHHLMARPDLILTSKVLVPACSGVSEVLVPANFWCQQSPGVS